jgi:hypothetical protein
MVISAEAEPGEPEYAHLSPIVDALRAMGNPMKQEWLLEKDGLELRIHAAARLQEVE